MTVPSTMGTTTGSSGEDVPTQSSMEGTDSNVMSGPSSGAPDDTSAGPTSQTETGPGETTTPVETTTLADTTSDDTTGTPSDDTTGGENTTDVEACPCPDLDVPLDDGIFVLSKTAVLWKFFPENNQFMMLGAVEVRAAAVDVLDGRRPRGVTRGSSSATCRSARST
jgi:hypothetical protein